MNRGRIDTPEYRAWQNMLSRCTNPRVPCFVRYGGRGITVCAGWRSFDDFVADMGMRPTTGHSLDRIDNDGSYTCGHCDDCKAHGAAFNCRWAPRSVQARNRRDNVWVEFGGERMVLSELRSRFGVSSALHYLRVHKSGWDLLRAATTPPNPKRGRPRRTAEAA